MKNKGNKRSVEVIRATIQALAEWLEEDGNKGEYTGNVPADWRWVLGTGYAAYRGGILFYSRGWGWRVRTSPAWRSVYAQRFESEPGATDGKAQA